MSPIKDRRCRDVFWLLLIIAATIGSVGLSIHATREADLDVLRYGISSKGGLCGKNANADKKYLMYCLNGTFMPSNVDDAVISVCSNTCPTSGTNIRDTYLAKKDEFLNAYSPYGSRATAEAFWEAGNYYNLRLYCVAPTFSLLHRCLYDFSYDSSSSSSSSSLPILYNSSSNNPGDDELGTSTQMFLNAYNDVAKAWHICLICGCAGGLVVSFFWLQMLKHVAGTLTAVTLCLTVALVIGMDVYLCGQAGWITNDWQQIRQGNFGDVDNTQIDEDYERMYQVLAIVALSLTAIMMLILFAMIRSIRLAVQLVKESADVIRTIPLLIVLPIVPSLWMLGLFVYFAVFAVYIAANGKVNESSGELDYEDNVRYAGIYHLCFTLWFYFFISALHSMVMGGTVSEYYWTRDKGSMRSPIMASIKRTLVYHTGSAAFGSLVLTIVRLVKWFLMYMAKKFEKANEGGPSSKLVKYLVACFWCCLQCIERFIQFVTKNAYILIAVDGKSFCYATGQAWNLITSNARRMTAANVVSAYLFFLAKIAVAVCCSILTSAWVNHKRDELECTSSFGPMVCTFVVAYFIAWLFFEVTDFAVDTLLVCFCLDDLKNGQSGNYFASPRLQKFMARANNAKVGKLKKERSKVTPGEF